MLLRDFTTRRTRALRDGVTTCALAAVIVHSGSVLLLRHGNTEPYAGTHVLPAGFLQDGEDPLQALTRIVHAETGLQVTSLGQALGEFDYTAAGQVVTQFHFAVWINTQDTYQAPPVTTRPRVTALWHPMDEEPPVIADVKGILGDYCERLAMPPSAEVLLRHGVALLGHACLLRYTDRNGISTQHSDRDFLSSLQEFRDRLTTTDLYLDSEIATLDRIVKEMSSS